MDPYSEAGGFDAEQSFGEGKRERGPRGPQNLTPVTCADVNSMTGEGLTFGNHQAEKVCIVGVVRSKEQSQMKVVLVVDDRTGDPVTCQSMDTSDPELERITEGLYVKVFGSVRRQSVNREESMKSIVSVVKIRAISALNEVSRHMLECVHARMSYLTAEKRIEMALNKAAGGGMGGATQASMGGNMSGSTSMMGGGGVGFGKSGVQGLNANQDMVYCTIKESGGLGMNISKVVEKMSAHGLKEREVRDSVEFLSNEGHVYSTVDDDTFACVDGV